MRRRSAVRLVPAAGRPSRREVTPSVTSVSMSSSRARDGDGVAHACIAVDRDGGKTCGHAGSWHLLARRRAVASVGSRAQWYGSVDRGFKSASVARVWAFHSVSRRRRLVHTLSCGKATAGRAPARHGSAGRGLVSSRVGLDGRGVAMQAVRACVRACLRRTYRPSLPRRSGGGGAAGCDGCQVRGWSEVSDASVHLLNCNTALIVGSLSGACAVRAWRCGGGCRRCGIKEAAHRLA